MSPEKLRSLIGARAGGRRPRATPVARLGTQNGAGAHNKTPAPPSGMKIADRPRHRYSLPLLAILAAGRGLDADVTQNRISLLDQSSSLLQKRDGTPCGDIPQILRSPVVRYGPIG